ncbi:MAG: Ltp family lipoprotein, partial [Treponemataceae bacterium]|nr:Ltp family lipoprotein [Treponemataceae bacterium]
MKRLLSKIFTVLVVMSLFLGCLVGLSLIPAQAATKPVGVSIKKITSGETYIKVTWSEAPSGITGLQVAYSTNKNMKASQKKNVKASATSLLIKDLNQSTTYYIRIRTYNKSSETKKKTYSDWSKIKKCETKGTPDDPSTWTMGQKQALKSAESYLNFSSFSKKGLYEQLSSEYGEGFTRDEAQFAVDHVKVNWKQEALESAESYLSFGSFSKKGLFDQLTSEYGEAFTKEEAQYAIDNVKVDWRQEAVEAAESYLMFSSFSRKGLYDQLTSEYGEQFTHEEAEYALQ